MPSWLSLRLVENPFRRRAPIETGRVRWYVSLAAVCTAASLLAGTGLIHWTRFSGVPSSSIQRPLAQRFSPRIPSVIPLGSRSMRRGRSRRILIRPRRHSGRVRSGLPRGFPVVKPKACTFGDPASAINVVLVGDSHAAQWSPALQRLADDRHWNLRVYTKSGCPFADAPVSLGNEERAYPECAAWNAAMLQILLDDPPDLVVTASSRYRLINGDTMLDASASDAEIVAGYRGRGRRSVSKNIPVVVLADTPRPGFDIGDCVSASSGHLTRCVVRSRRALQARGVVLSTAAAGTAAKLVDLTDAICPDDPCSR